MAIIILFIGGLIIISKIIEYQNAHYYENAMPAGEIEKRYTKLGSYETSYEEYKAKTDDYVKYEIWYPSELVSSDKVWPMVIMANGTGVKASQYKEVFEHLASWGFVVVGNEDENSRTGASSAETLDYMLNLNENSASKFYKKIDINHIGIGGHSQGGVGVINAATSYANSEKYAALWTASATSPYWGQDDVFGPEWRYDASKISIPIFMTAGTGSADSGTATNIEAREGQGICPLWGMEMVYNSIPDTVAKIMARETGKDHGDMLRYADGYMTAWFAYWLQGDELARGAFFGVDAEILSNTNWQDVKINN